MKEIRLATPRKPVPSWLEPTDLVCREDYLGTERVKAASMTLFPTGCEYAAVGGCTMCGEWSGSNLGDLVSAQFHVAQFAAGSAKLLSEKDVRWLRIYQEGSFLNSAEVAPEAREVILKLASKLTNIQRITIESRPEYLTENVANTLQSFMGNVELEIGIGLEAKDDYIRNVCVGKGTVISSYQKAVKIAHKNGIIALGYVILKPPFLTEAEGIAEAIETTRYAFEIGFDEVYIQAASIHEWSLSELLALKHLYSPPWLWSMLKVVQETAHWGKVKIGGLEYFPRPAFISQNYKNIDSGETCECSQDIWEAIQNFNATGDINLFSGLSCSCKSIWNNLLATTSQPLQLRVHNHLAEVSIHEYLNAKNIP